MICWGRAPKEKPDRRKGRKQSKQWEKTKNNNNKIPQKKLSLISDEVQALAWSDGGTFGVWIASHIQEATVRSQRQELFHWSQEPRELAFHALCSFLAQEAASALRGPGGAETLRHFQLSGRCRGVCSSRWRSELRALSVKAHSNWTVWTRFWWRGSGKGD